MFVDPTRDPPTRLVPRALCLQRTALAGSRGIVADLTPELHRLEAEVEGFAGRTQVTVPLRIVAKVFFGQQPALAVGGGVRFGYVGNDAFLETGLHFLSVVVTHVRKHVHLLDRHGFLSASRHPVKLDERSGSAAPDRSPRWSPHAPRSTCASRRRLAGHCSH